MSTSTPKRYVPAVSSRLRKLLYFVFALVALLGANSIYLASITSLEWLTGEVYQNYFYLLMFLGHLVLGLALIAPFLIFGFVHLWKARGRKNRRAIRVGYALFVIAIIALVTGLLLVRVVGLFDLRRPWLRLTIYWLHVVCPLVACWLYWLHRLAGPRIRWRIGLTYAGVVGVAVLVIVGLHRQDPRTWNRTGPDSGTQYFKPSLARTSTGKFIPAKSLMRDQYCLQCHADVHASWHDSVHHLSSFNNPAYLAAVRETREVVQKRDGSVQASRWCAGCHDPVPFFSGAFDDPNFDDINHPTAAAGITCSVCHSITHINSTRGNADFTIEEPLQYPFAYSENSALQWINQQMIKAKPSLHKKTFLKEFHKSAEFCAACHKVHLPYEVTNYKGFLRGQNHYDSYFLSGVSGHGARSFYYPKCAETNCNGCHMPLQASDDFGAKFFPDAKQLSVHDHLFPSANTALSWMRNRPKVTAEHQKFLRNCLRVDIFGIKEQGTIDGKLHAPLRPKIPTLKPGNVYLLETVLRALTLGHHFTQGTTDSNEVWLDVTVTSGGRVIGRSGDIDQSGAVNPESHFVNVFMLDKNGNRISRRNAQDIFTPLYNHQIAPGTAQVVHYRLALPENVNAPVTVEVKLLYRKFDQTYMKFVADAAKQGDPPLRGHVPGKAYRNELPVTTIATDSITFPILGTAKPAAQKEVAIPTWQRWNDYGIGLLLEGKGSGGRREFRQAAEAFEQVEKLGRYDGPLNLARVYFQEGRLEKAVAALSRAEASKPPAPDWSVAWFAGKAYKQQGELDLAIERFRSILQADSAELRKRKFDFSRDYVVINELGTTLFERAKQELGEKNRQLREQLLRESIATFQKTLALDAENLTAHYNLSLLYSLLGEEKDAKHHQSLHERYRPDDTARGRATSLASKKYPAAYRASLGIVIYPLELREGAKK